MKIPIYISALLFLALSSRAQNNIIDIGSGSVSGPSKHSELERMGSTLIFSGVNLTLNTFTAINFKKKKKKSNAGFGIVCGAAQIANGVIFNEKEKDLQSIDISIGAATIIFNTIGLFKKNKQKKEEKLSLAPCFSRAPFYGKITGLALRLKF